MIYQSQYLHRSDDKLQNFFIYFLKMMFFGAFTVLEELIFLLCFSKWYFLEAFRVPKRIFKGC